MVIFSKTKCRERNHIPSPGWTIPNGKFFNKATVRLEE